MNLSGQNDRTASHAAASDNDRHLARVLDEYVAALEAGTAAPVAEFAQRHPELGAELVECLEGVRTIHAAVAAAKDAEPTAAQSGEGYFLPAGDSAPTEIGDYQIVREIGRGGMGVVYEAVERSLRRRVALKVLPFAAVLDQRQITRFRNEAQAAAGLHHANIVPVFAIGEERGVHYYAMQHIDGRSLAEAITELRSDGQGSGATPSATTQAMTVAGALSTSIADKPGDPLASAPTATSLGPTNRDGGFCRAAAKLAADAADALQHAHELGVVHRDVKPSNLLIDSRGKVWVADFGLARMQTDLGVTATGDVVGTLRYMSPEQASGHADQVDGRTDVYALGATLYELLTLRHAHPGENRQQMLDQLQRVDPTPPRKLNPSLPVDLENIVLRAMEKDRDARYASAGELRDDLRRFLDGRPTVARPPTVADRVGKWMRRRRRAVATAAVASVVVALVSLGSLVLVNQARGRAEAALTELKQQTARSEQLERDAREMVYEFGVVLTDELATLPGSEPIRAEILQDTMAYYRRFLDESVVDPTAATDVATTRIRAGATAERLAQTDEAFELYGQAIEQLDAALVADPSDTKAAEGLARALYNRGRIEADRDHFDAATAAIGRAARLRRGLLAEDPADSQRVVELAEVLIDGGAVLPSVETKRAWLDEAIRLLAASRGRDPKDQLLIRRQALAYNSFASLRGVEDPQQARAANDEAIKLIRRLVQDEPRVEAYRADLAMALSNRGALSAARRDWSVSARAYGDAAAQLGWLAKYAPLVPRHRSEQAVALASQASVLSWAKERGRSNDAFDAADRILRALVTDYPSEERYQRSLAALWNNRGVALRDGNHLDEAAEAFAQSVALEEKRLRSTNQPGPTLLATHYANQAQVLVRLKRFEEAAAVETKRQALLGETGRAAIGSATLGANRP